MQARIVVLVLMLAGRVGAQPLNSVGQPLPDTTMTAGTVTVRVVVGEITRPAEGVPVTLAIAGGASKIIKTDASGRAQFENIAAKSRVTVSFPSTAPELARSTFVMPDAGGIRLFMSSAKWKAADAPPSPRSFSGQPRLDPDVAAGTLSIRLTYDNLADPKPPSGIAVALVGYAADGKVTVQTKPTDPRGVADFTALDTSQRTAYFAIAQLPRAGGVDRLVADPVTLDPSSGARLTLSSHRRDAKEPPIDLEKPVPKGKLRVELAGIADPGGVIEVVDATSGKVIATAPRKDPETVLDVKPGHLIYAQTTFKGESYRSRPIQTIADRGASLGIVVVPRLTPKFDIVAFVDDDVLAMRMRWLLQNHSWSPTAGGLEVPLPAGFKGLVISDGDAAIAKPTPRGFRVDAPLPPGGRSLLLGVSLPIVNQKVKVSMELPIGTFDSSLRLKADPGVSFAELPAGVSPGDASGYSVVAPISLLPGASIAFTVTAPKPDPTQIAIKKACRELAPNRDSPLIGRPFVEFTAPQLDGKPFTLSSLKGKLVFVTFNASWTSLRGDQKTLPALVKKLGGELVTVLSDTDLADVQKGFGALSGRVVLDKPVRQTLGPITGSYGITAVPETYVIDRKGVIKFHVINQRDWSVPSTLACLKTGI